MEDRSSIKQGEGVGWGERGLHPSTFLIYLIISMCMRLKNGEGTGQQPSLRNRQQLWEGICGVVDYDWLTPSEWAHYGHVAVAELVLLLRLFLNIQVQRGSDYVSWLSWTALQCDGDGRWSACSTCRSMMVPSHMLLQALNDGHICMKKLLDYCHFLFLFHIEKSDSFSSEFI